MLHCECDTMHWQIANWLCVSACNLSVRLQHVPLLSETLRMLATNDLSAAAYPYAAGSQVRTGVGHISLVPK